MEAKPGERMVFSTPDYCKLAKQFRISIRSLFVPPSPPVYYAQVCSKEDNEVVCLMWFDGARESWIAFAPEETTDEIEGLFS